MRKAFYFMAVVLLAKTISAQQNKIIRLSDEIGDTISIDEKVKYGLFPNFRNAIFNYAIILNTNDSLMQCTTVLIDTVIKNQINNQELDFLNAKVSGNWDLYNNKYLHLNQSRQQTRAKNTQSADSRLFFVIGVFPGTILSGVQYQWNHHLFTFRGQRTHNMLLFAGSYKLRDVSLLYGYNYQIRNYSISLSGGGSYFDLEKYRQVDLFNEELKSKQVLYGLTFHVEVTYIISENLAVGVFGSAHTMKNNSFGSGGVCLQIGHLRS